MEEKLYQSVCKVIYWLTIVLAYVLTIVVSINVASRYIFGVSIFWSEEITRFLFIWCSCLGIVLLNDKGELMQLGLLITYLNKRFAQIAIQLFANTVCLLLSILLLVGGIVISIESMSWASPILGVPNGVVYCIVPFCCVILIWQFIRRYAKIFMRSEENA